MKPDSKKGQATQKRELHPPARSGAQDAEPATGQGGVPIVLFVLLALGLFLAMRYLDDHAGGFNPVVPRGFVSSNQLVTNVPIDPGMVDFYAGMKVYNRPTCGACHQPNGMGTPGTFPPLAGSEWVLEKDPARVVRIILDGLTGPIQVKGAAYNSQMPGWRAQLSEEEIAQVATYIRKAWGNTGGSVTKEQVAAIKKETENRNGALWTVDDLMKIPLKE
ncbi:MAG TPA: cytochrome c [Candidatus Kapabacteria bacterium]|nr:cytochrome c [Candidatus Kapabacteria bacterium]